jgi:thioredoxin
MNMHKQDLIDRSVRSSKPIVVEFWAQWCMPCKLMTPALEKTAHRYNDSVDLIRINADENPQTVKDFGILGIPSIVVLSNGHETTRHTGSLNEEQLNALFQGVATDQEILIPPSTFQRISRIISGLALIVYGYFWGSGLYLYPLGAILLFSAFYDRCPVFRMLFPKIKSIFRPKKVETI